MKKENINTKTEEQILEEAYTIYMQELIKLHILVNRFILVKFENYTSFFKEQPEIMEKNLQTIEKNLKTIISNIEKANIDVDVFTQPTKQR